jgi:hypothetical protein
VGGERVDEVGVEAAALEAAGGVGPPAIRRDDRAGVGRQRLGVLFAAVGGDSQDGVPVGKRAP